MQKKMSHANLLFVVKIVPRLSNIPGSAYGPDDDDTRLVLISQPMVFDNSEWNHSCDRVLRRLLGIQGCRWRPFPLRWNHNLALILIFYDVGWFLISCYFVGIRWSLWHKSAYYWCYKCFCVTLTFYHSVLLLRVLILYYICSWIGYSNVILIEVYIV
jgi:hypothetical protein